MRVAPTPMVGRQGVVTDGPVALAGGAVAVFTGREEGDLGGTDGEPSRRRRAVVDLPWSVLRQVHGSCVVEVDTPGSSGGGEGDALVSARAGAALAVLTADCAPVVFSTPEGIIGVAHAGWRGLEAGVVEATVASLQRMGATRIEAVLGPCIHPCCYRFGAADLTRLVDRFGSGVAATDRVGSPALDVPAAVRAALGAAGVTKISEVDVCTACSTRHWSWRARADTRRQATVIWR